MALLGRIYKDRWDLAKKEGLPEARALLKSAIDTYLAGFEADWRDAYPGINAVTLMEMMPKPDPRQAEILPVVRYSAARKAAKNPDYWDHATLLELAVLARDAGRRRRAARRCAGRGARLMGARDDRAQSVADPRDARGARRGCGLDQAARGHAEGARGRLEGDKDLCKLKTLSDLLTHAMGNLCAARQRSELGWRARSIGQQQ